MALGTNDATDCMAERHVDDVTQTGALRVKGHMALFRRSAPDRSEEKQRARVSRKHDRSKRRSQGSAFFPEAGCVRRAGEVEMKLLALFIVFAIALLVALRRKGVRASMPGQAEASRTRPSKLLIVGATGGTGRELVRQALERGFEVTAVARDPSKVGLSHPRLTVVRGDVLDRASIDVAMRGREAVLCALGHRKYFGPSRILSEGTRNLLRSMEASGVSRIVCETSLGIGDSAGRLGLYYTFFVIPLILPFYFWDKARQERLIEQASIEWVIVRPSALTNGVAKGRQRHGPGVGSFLLTERIARADVAEFMLNQLESNAYLRSTVAVSGRRRP
jgi:uncharacterized protein YbjT (DUF2867 family)